MAWVHARPPLLGVWRQPLGVGLHWDEAFLNSRPTIG